MKFLFHLLLMIVITNNFASEHFNHRLTLVYAQEYSELPPDNNQKRHIKNLYTLKKHS